MFFFFNGHWQNRGGKGVCVFIPSDHKYVMCTPKMYALQNVSGSK